MLNKIIKRTKYRESVNKYFLKLLFDLNLSNRKPTEMLTINLIEANIIYNRRNKPKKWPLLEIIFANFEVFWRYYDSKRP